jgi:hypothetical protein
MEESIQDSRKNLQPTRSECFVRGKARHLQICTAMTEKQVIQTTNNNKMSRRHPAPRALPSISIAIAAMTPNHGAVTPHESIAGTSRRILCDYSTFEMLKNYQKHDSFINGRTDDSILSPMPQWACFVS